MLPPFFSLEVRPDTTHIAPLAVVSVIVTLNGETLGSTYHTMIVYGSLR